MSSIVVVDYGSGNLRSVSKALERVGAECVVSAEPSSIAEASAVLLPGVGAFRTAMDQLSERGFIDPIREHIAANKPFLGICLGLQLLFERSEEFGETPGLGLLPGSVRAFPQPDTQSGGLPEAKVPHMGWNQLSFQNSSPLFEGIEDGAWVYFVHSFYADPTDESVETARTTHGLTFTAAVGRGSMMACQFHPEKSQDVGLRMLRNFKEMCS